MPVYCQLCKAYVPDDPTDHERGKKHARNAEQCLRMGYPVPPMTYGVMSPNDEMQAIKSEEARRMKSRGLPQGQDGHIYCSLCQVWSGSLIAHNLHCKGRRHRRAEEGMGAAVRAPARYASHEERCEQEAYKAQYVALVRDVLSYVRHHRGLVKAEHRYDVDTVTTRINSTHPDQLASDGAAFFGCRLVDDFVNRKSSDATFALRAPAAAAAAAPAAAAVVVQPDIVVGTSVYVTPSCAPYVPIDDRSVTMMGEVVAVTPDRLVVKNLVGRGRPFLSSPTGEYRIDLGVPTVPTERMKQALQMLRKAAVEKLRGLGIQDKINIDEYISDDDEDDDAFPVEGRVPATGIFEPFTKLGWCAFHDVHASVNATRRVIYNTFSHHAVHHPELRSDDSSGMKALGNQPTAADISAAAREPHALYAEHVAAPTPATATAAAPRLSQGLNPSQQEAVARVVDEGRSLSLIQGPPGTGKTTTAVAIIAEWVRKHRGHRILATAHSNTGLDNLMSGLLKRGVRCLRVGRSAQPELQDYSLETYVQADAYSRDRSALQERINELRSMMAAAEANGEPVAAIGREWKDLSRKLKTTYSKSNAVHAAIRGAEVICATCISSGSNVLTGVNFPFVLIDEATQATETSTLVPLFRGSIQAVMIGDQAQLPPTVLSYQCAQRGLDVSLFDRMIGAGVDVSLLSTQYRMHPAIAHFSNTSFYGARVQNGVSEEQRTLQGGALPGDRPVSFTDVRGAEETQGTSRANRAEAEAVAVLLRQVGAEKAVAWENIGVITPYSAQVRAIRSEVSRNLGSDVRNAVEVKSVDGFQGREKDVIILSMVRSGGPGGGTVDTGFISEWRRINVALTRAKYGVCVVGDVRTLLQSPFWHTWVQMYKDVSYSIGPEKKTHSP
eukprot:Rhum_TRINITY_DN12585_c0_g1::Rhum_TRINITY_DN12585_c0_g1_i1::g.52443::m.52443/K14326/UPF1, RENT1; regulator of nonsense transcripts 1